MPESALVRPQPLSSKARESAAHSLPAPWRPLYLVVLGVPIPTLAVARQWQRTPFGVQHVGVMKLRSD